MLHLPPLISDLALILATAAIAALIFRRLNQPVVLGYLVAGFLVGPNMNLFPTVADLESVNLWAELGVVFLLFALGLEFSFKKLAKEGMTTGMVTAIEVVGMFFSGFAIGSWMGWSLFDSLFLAGIVSISSTSIILRIFDEMGLKSRKYVAHVFGILVFEDMAAVLLLVLLSTLAVSQKFAGMEMLTSLFKLVFFLSIWFIAGVFLLPGFIKRAQKHLSDEIGLVMGLGICLAMAAFASAVGFSAALGAFIAGSLLSETSEGERIHHVVSPVRDLFSAVFFVSVGMLINPKVILGNASTLGILVFLVIFGKTFFISVGSVLAGQSVRNSISSALAMSQIGEFSFIIATLGLTLGVVSEKLYPLAVAVSVLTSFMTPILIRNSDRIADGVIALFPKNWVHTMDEYSMFRVRASGEDAIREALKSYVIRLLSNATVVVGLFLLSSRVLLPWMLERQFEEATAKLVVISVELVLSLPFLWAISFGKMEGVEIVFANLGEEGRRSPLRMFIISRIMISAVLLTLMVAQYVSGIWAFFITAWILLLVGYTLNKQMGVLYQRFEDQFLKNLGGASKQKTKESRFPRLAPWDAHIVEFQIEPEWKLAGSLLSDLAIRERFGVSVTLIERGKLVIPAPSAHEKLLPMDKIHVIGTDAQLQQFQKFLEVEEDGITQQEVVVARYNLEPVLLGADCRFIGKSIRDSGLRDQVKGMLVGIERDGHRRLNPHSDEVFRSGDLLWVVGDSALIKQLRQEAQLEIPKSDVES